MLLKALTLVHVGLFLYFVRENFIAQPYWDMLSIVTRYLQYERDGNLLSYLWEPHVQHRQVWMRLLTAFDARVLGGTAYPFVAFAAACQLLSGLFVWRLVRRHARGPENAALACLSVMLVLTSVAAVTCAIPMNGIYPQAWALSLAALACFAGDGASLEGRSGAVRGVFGVLAAIAAAFGNAAALVLWPILVWLAWQGGARRYRIALIAVAGVSFAALYVSGLPGSGVGEGASVSWLRAGDYLLAYVGLPWTRAAALALPGRLLGAALLVVAAVVGARALWRPVPHSFDRLALALVGFTLATALLASFGRSGLDDDLRVPVRYSVFVAPLHLGLLWLAWPRLSAWLVSRGRQGLLRALVLVVACALFAQQYASGRAAAATTADMRATLARFAAGEETPEMTAVVFVDLAQARRDLDAIHAAGLYLGIR